MVISFIPSGIYADSIMSVDVFDVRLLESQDSGVVAAGSVFDHVEVAHASVHIPPLAGG